MTKLDLITQKINEVKPSNKYETAAKAKVLAEYMTIPEKLEEVPFERIHNFSFRKQIFDEAGLAKRFDRLKEVTVKLERHMYAPELDCLHFKNETTFKVKGREFGIAINYAALNMKESEYQKAISPIKK